MSLSSNLVVMHCPKCDRAILATSTRCQFCGAEVAPTAVATPLAPAAMPRRRPNSNWQETANAIFAGLWILGGGLEALMSLMLGPIGLLFLAFGVGVIFIGIGLYQQQWVAQMLAKICCAILVVQQTYMLIASPFLAAAGAHYSSATSIFLILFFSFQLYVIWSVSD